VSAHVVSGARIEIDRAMDPSGTGVLGRSEAAICSADDMAR
jgi:hypothetical protein